MSSQPEKTADFARPGSGDRACASLKLADACSDLVRNRRGAGDAEDAVQDACVRALQIAEPQEIKEPVRYVMRIARNMFVDHRRRRGRDARLFEHSQEAALAADDHPSPERILAGKEALAGIMAAIEALPPRCREAFVLHRFEHLNYPAIAQRMKISISMVEKHIAEAMVRLSRTLQHEEGDA